MLVQCLLLRDTQRLHLPTRPTDLPQMGLLLEPLQELRVVLLLQQVRVQSPRALGEGLRARPAQGLVWRCTCWGQAVQLGGKLELNSIQAWDCSEKKTPNSN